MEFYFDELPNELAFSIFEKLDLVSKVRQQRVCRKWRAMLRDKQFASTVCITQGDMGPLLKGTERVGETMARLAAGGYDITRSVRHLILVGEYDYRNENLDEPTEDENPFKFSQFAIIFLESLDRYNEDWGDWTELTTVTLRNACVGTWWLNVNKFRRMHLHCTTDANRGPICESPGDVVVRKLILSNVTIVHTIYDIDVEFFIENSSINVSGDFGCIGCSLNCCSKDLTDGPAPPAEVTAFCAQKALSISPEEVMTLKPTYETLMKGREGCVIRDEAITLLSSIDEDQTYKLKNRSLRGTAYMKDTFARANPYFYYCLLYYSKARNFFRVASAEELALMKDKEGNPVQSKFEINLYREWKMDEDDDNDQEKCVLC